MEPKSRGYYAIIPADIRYDQNITANAKLLYGEITALCNEKGYCWATNKYFSELYGTSIRSIQTWISSLEEWGYIKTRLKETELGSQRYISLSPASPPREKNFTPPCKNFHGGHEEIFTHNITSNNTSNNTLSASTVGSEEFFEKIWTMYPNKKGKGQVSKTQKAKLAKVGYEHLKRCIDRYLADLKKDEWRKPQNGSTFFNSGYVDYLDDNYSFPTASEETDSWGGIQRL